MMNPNGYSDIIPEYKKEWNRREPLPLYGVRGFLFKILQRR
ncbi:hypothetical protein J2S24_001425 [Thermoanaerobacter pentosaceus]|uniref:Uncharacterized protein n=1 Tax=Thermoanaerobacter pentosaceus TaxID=694059 RepID=A0ABT9M483_9THEO|nr:hypothetical protein [Thermoanaerobacter pentosaceus]